MRRFSIYRREARRQVRVIASTVWGALWVFAILFDTLIVVWQWVRQ